MHAHIRTKYGDDWPGKQSKTNRNCLYISNLSCLYWATHLEVTSVTLHTCIVFFHTYFLHTNNAFNFFTILVSLLNSFSKEGKNRASSTSFSPWESKPLDKTTVLVHGAIIWHCNFNPRYTLKRTENVFSHKNLYMSTHSSIIKNVEEKQNIYQQIEKHTKVRHVRTMTYYSSIKRNTCYNMEKPWKCTRWKKPVIRPHIA